ncbi:MAG: EamA family transporter [Actinomycetaceae bacterium]
MGRILATSVAPLTWATTYYVASEFMPPDSVMFTSLMRALPAGIIALLIARTLPTGSWWWKSFVLGALNIGVYFPLLFTAAERLPGGVAATLGACQPLIVVLLTVAVLSERLSAWRLTWGVVGIVGVGLVVLGPGAVFDPVGMVAGLIGAACMATGIVLTKKWGRPEGISPVGYAGWQLGAGGIILLVPTLAIEGVPSGIDATAVAGYAWLGLVGGLLAYTLWFAGIRVLPAPATSLLNLLIPLGAAALGVAFAGETLNALQLIGFALALCAMAAGQFPPPGSRAGAASEEGSRPTAEQSAPSGPRTARPAPSGVTAGESATVDARTEHAAPSGARAEHDAQAGRTDRGHSA